MNRSHALTMTAVSLGIALVVSAPAAAVSPPAVAPAVVDSTEKAESAGDIVPGVSKLFVQRAGRASAERIRGKKAKRRVFKKLARRAGVAQCHE